MPAASLLAAVDQGASHLAGMHNASWVAMRDGAMGAMYPETLNIPHDIATTDFTPNVESIRALNPDVVVQWSDAQLTAPLEQAGMKVLGITNTGTQQDVDTWTALFATMLGRPDRAVQMKARSEGQQKAIQAEAAARGTGGPGIIYFNRFSGGLKVAGSGSYNDFYIKLIGAHNPATGPQGLQGKGMVGVDVEQVLAWDPEIILLGNFDGAMPADVYANPVWQCFRLGALPPRLQGPAGRLSLGSPRPGIATDVALAHRCQFPLRQPLHAEGRDKRLLRLPVPPPAVGAWSWTRSSGPKPTAPRPTTGSSMLREAQPLTTGPPGGRGSRLRQVIGPCLLSGAVLAAVSAVALASGRYSVSLDHVVQILASQIVPFGPGLPAAEEPAVLLVRLPRVLLALLVGGALAIGGAALQAVFRNPLVSPEVIGVSSGASFGGALALLLGLGPVALVGGIVRLRAAGTGNRLPHHVRAGRRPHPHGGPRRNRHGFVLLRLVALVTYLADPFTTLPAIVFWLLGSVSTATWAKVLVALIPIAAGGVVLLALRWRINVLSLGDDDATALVSGPAPCAGRSSPPWPSWSPGPSPSAASSAGWGWSSPTSHACGWDRTTACCCRSPSCWAGPT